MARRVQLDPAYILNARPYGDTSLLIEALSREHGRVGLVAKGARGPKSKTRALLQPLRPLLLSWNESGDLGGLTGAEALGAPPELAGETLFCGWYLNELLLKLLQRHDPHPPLFDAYVEALTGLTSQIEPTLRRFEMQLLNELGYGLLLADDLDPALHYRYDWEVGPVPVAPGYAEAYEGASLIALRDDALTAPTALRAARKLLRVALARQLGGRELATAKMLRELRHLAPAREPHE